MSRAIDIIDTPIGRYRLTASERGLTQVTPEIPNPPAEDAGPWSGAARRHLREARAALEAYFDGEHAPFDALAIASAGTPFQSDVWRALRCIPFGGTLSYGELARRVGRSGAARAVGLANGRNPLAIVVPCHRVIGATGALRGYAGGIERKRWLLRHEGAMT